MVECKTYRHRGHFEGDPCVYRNEEELAEWKTKDPLIRFEKKLLEMQVLKSAKAEEIRQGIQKQVKEAVDFAEKSLFPEIAELLEDVYTA